MQNAMAVNLKWQAMTSLSVQDLADKKVLYLATVGRRTGLPREIEIWFVIHSDRFYLFSETGRSRRVGQKHSTQSRSYGPDRRHCASARRRGSLTASSIVSFASRSRRIAVRKYDGGDGLPVEITPVTPATETS